MRRFYTDTWYLFRRLVRATLRMPVFAVMSILQPMIWLLIFGQLFSAVTRLPGFEGDSYAQYLTPGIAVMTALFGSAFTGIGLLAEIDSGFLDRLLATPVSRGAIIAARLVMASTQVVVQVTVILILAYILGARPQQGLLGLAAVYLSAALLGAASAAFSNVLALVTLRHELIIAPMNLLVGPMIFLSSIMMTPELMPGWIRVVARFNPVDWAVTAGRIGYEGGDAGVMAGRLAVLAVFALLAGWFATRAFERYRSRI